MTCATCHQPIQRGEESDTFRGEDFHQNPCDCVAATARKCAGIAWENEPEGEEFGSAEIRREFPAAFAQRAEEVK